MRNDIVKNFPLISVIIPSLNQGIFLRECIESIIGQKYEALEIVVIDGGSIDDSISIVKSYENYLKYWVSEKDFGQSDAINKGFLKCNGDIVTWLNSDDFYLPNAFDELIKMYKANPEAPFYYADGIRVDKAGTKISNFFPLGSPEFNREGFAYGLNYLLQPSVFINHKKLKEINYLDSTLRYGMDSDLWLRLSGLGEPLPLIAKVSASREYAETKTSSGSFERIEELRMIAKKHTGLEFTPGILCYFLNTLLKFVGNNRELFHETCESDTVVLWKKISSGLRKFNLRADGFPVTNNLTIGVDLRQLVIGASGGISQLTKGVLEQLFSIYSESRFIVFCTPFNRSLIEYEGENVTFYSLPTFSYINQMDSIAVSEKVDVLFRAYPMEDNLKFPMGKQIILIPDNQHERHPEFFSIDALRTRRVAFAKALGESGAIATISNFALNELKKFPDTKVTDLFLMEPSLQESHANSNGLADLTSSEIELIPDGDYFIYPANLWKHKNHNNVLKAFELFLKNTNRKVEFLFTGHPEGWSDLIADHKHLPLKHLGYVRPELLRVLLGRASSLVFFSIYEGFGIPLLEAFEAGTPVICSNTTSLPEVGGDAVLSCSPTDIKEMALLMQRILDDQLLRKSLIQNGKKRLHIYSWEQAANNLMSACKRVSNLASEDIQIVNKVKKQLPLVSIVTPSFNQGRFLKRTIDSVLTQDYQNVEYIVIDGGSTDESLDILNSYGDQFFWMSESDKGQTDAINKGMLQANGDILAYLNSDDVLMPGAITRIVNYFDQHPECGMVYGNADYIDADDHFIGTYKTADYSFERLMQDCMVCQPASFWRKSVAEIVGPFDEKLNFVMDYEYWIRIAKSGAGINFIKEKIACSRLYPETKTMSARAKIYKEIFEISRKYTGRINVSFYLGLWHYKIFERRSLANHLIRLIPNVHLIIGWMHHKLDHKEQYKRENVIAFSRKIAIFLLNRFGLTPIVKQVLKFLSPVTHSEKTVVGLYSDNWISDVLIVKSKSYKNTQVMHIAGVSPMNSTMKLYLGESLIIQHQFVANEYGKAEFLLGETEGMDVRAVFSTFMIDAAGRRLSFLLQDTNLFGEQDTQ